MPLNLFGFTIARKTEEEPIRVQAFTAPENEDGSVEIAPLAGTYGTFLDQDGQVKNEASLITLYREMAMYPECDYAIDDIVNEAIINEEDRLPVSLILDNTKVSDSIKKKIHEEFEVVLELLDFDRQCYDIFRKWYIDGRLYYHIIIDTKAPQRGIQELRYIDPRKIRKVKVPDLKKIQKVAGAPNAVPEIKPEPKEFYVYNPLGLDTKNDRTDIRLAIDSVSYNHSGILNSKKSLVVSHLHKAVKSFNQLRMLEDAVVIYRLSRAPERRVFYVDVGNLPKIKAEQYLRDVMVRFKNKITYNASTGEIMDDRQHRTLMEDYWLPRRDGGRGTEVVSLPGGENLGQIEDVMYFRKKMFRAMNVPISRLEAETGFNVGRSAEITRDEVKFGKFIGRLQLKFSELFLNLLCTQLRLRKIMTIEEWNKIKTTIHFRWATDTHFLELQNAEIMRARIEMLREIEEFRGEYFSKEWIQKNVLRQSNDVIQAIEKQIKKEPDPEPDEDQMGAAPAGNPNMIQGPSNTPTQSPPSPTPTSREN